MLGAVIIAVAVAGMLVYWFVFRWDATPKRWCVMFYMTSNIPASTAPVHRPAEETGVPSASPTAASLDDKLDQVVNDVIRRLPCATAASIAADPAWDDVYVVYRAIWDNPQRPPEARVVRPESSAPSATYFPGETVFDVGYAIDFTKDLTKFFEWAYDNCPAQQYAVFFWGHAMGPAGFFQPSERPVVVSPLMAFLMKVLFRLTGTRWSGTPGLPAISDAIESIVQQRYKDTGPRQFETVAGAAAPPNTTIPPGGPLTPVDPSAQAVFTVGETIPKVDVVLFQDCWMSTLETAFELQDDVRYIVSSQSLVPAGFDAAQQLGAVWPYKELIDTFLHPGNFTADMMQVLEDFFNDVLPPGTAPGYNRYPATKVLFSLIDCDTTAGAVSSALQADFTALVQALSSLGPTLRAMLIDGPGKQSGRLYEITTAGELKVGDQALIDVLTLCDFLGTPTAWPAALTVTKTDENAIRNAAQSLRLKLAPLVVRTFQSPPFTAGDLYTGVSALYKPFTVVGDDPYIVNAFRSSYEKFRFARESDVTPPPQTVGGTSGQSWTQYAFDRHQPL